MHNGLSEGYLAGGAALADTLSQCVRTKKPCKGYNSEVKVA